MKNKGKWIVAMFQKIYNRLKPGGKLYSISFTTETTGYGTGESWGGERTFYNITEGSLAGCGTIHFFLEAVLRRILMETGFRDIVVDQLRFTDRGSVIEQFLVQAVK